MPIEHLHGGRVKSVYREWAEEQGIPIIAGHYVPDLAAMRTEPWTMMGGRGCLLHHEATERSNNCYVLEFDASDRLPEQKHLYEEIIYVLAGEGSTTLWHADGREVTFAWQAGALFAILGSACRYVSFSALLESLSASPSLGLFDGLDGERLEFAGEVA